MPSAAFTTLGCKVNQYETQRILESFAEAGFEVVPFDSPADLYVINTCSVTSIAESKSRYTLRRALRNNPAARVVATGCAAQMAINHGESIPGADIVVPNPEKLRTIDFVRAAFPDLFPPQSEICNLKSEIGARSFLSCYSDRPISGDPVQSPEIATSIDRLSRDLS